MVDSARYRGYYNRYRSSDYGTAKGDVVSTAVLFIMGVLLVWLAVTGKAENMITALTGGSGQTDGAGGQQDGVRNAMIQTFMPGVPYDHPSPIGMPQTFAGPQMNPGGYNYVPPYVSNGSGPPQDLPRGNF